MGWLVKLSGTTAHGHFNSLGKLLVYKKTKMEAKMNNRKLIKRINQSLIIFLCSISLLPVLSKESLSIDQESYSYFPCIVETFEDYVNSPCYEMQITDEQLLIYLNQEIEHEPGIFTSLFTNCLNDCSAKALNYFLDPLKRVVSGSCITRCFQEEISRIQDGTWVDSE